MLSRARIVFALTALAVLAGLVVQLGVSATDDSVFGGSAWGRALNAFAFFTILSNVIVGVTTGLLAINPDRPSLVFRVARLTGVVAIAVTGIVYHVALSGLLDLDSWAQVANQLLHTVVPIVAVLGWLAYGPRDAVSPRIAKLTVIYPLAYMVFTTIRGPLSSDWYPYPFADVGKLGYFPVIVNALWISVLFVSLAFGAVWVDRRLPGLSAPDSYGGTRTALETTPAD
jgi:hypothetical protein